MQTIDFIVQPHLDLACSLATDRHLLRVARASSLPQLGALRVYEFAGDVLSLGRYHRVPPLTSSTRIHLHRRQSGGRVVSCGDGFVGVTLVLPHRSALFSQDPLFLAPERVMNRYVRGILTGCRLASLSPFYPGRDVVTIARRIVAVISFEVDVSGALLFEAVIANRRDFSMLPIFLDAVDAAGIVKAEMLTGDNTTCLARELKTEVSTEEVAELMRRGFEQEFGLTCRVRDRQVVEAEAANDAGDSQWLEQRQVRAELDRHACERSQLGWFEAFLALADGRFIKDIVFAGDFIANSGAIARLERQLRLCPATWPAINAIATDVFAQPDNFILGIGPIRTITDAICKALPS